MPLLMCPNDNSPMQTVSRSGVDFDMCPTCRGVWLDRGELEKLMGAARGGEGGGDVAPPRPQQTYQEPRRYEPDRRYEDPRRWEDDRYRHKKKRGLDIFDIFD